MSEKDYGLHQAVWEGSLSLASILPETELEVRDPHGRTALMLAVMLGRADTAKILVDAGADVNTETEGWTVVQEATARGDPDLVQLVLDNRDRARYSARLGGIPHLLQKLQDAPDFYVEMTWEFTSWVPLVSRMCPSDTYRVYKQGNSVRVDTTLLGFDQHSWLRGSRSYIFTGTESGVAKFTEIDHDTKQVYTEEMGVDPDLGTFKYSSAEQVQHRLSTPLIQTFLDTENISFQRSKSGLFGWGGDKSEEVHGQDCKVFAANNVEIVTKTRTEHMSQEDRDRARANKNPLLSFFGPQDVETEAEGGAGSEISAEPSRSSPSEPPASWAEYLARGWVRPRQEARKSQKFKAQLWLAEDYPLSLQEQVMPIVDLLAISNTHFKKLKDFIHMQLPSGFPVKIEIPLFHVINARITFSNIQALDSPVQGVTSLQEDSGRSSVAMEDAVFEVPREYEVLGGSSENTMRMYNQGNDEEEIMLQYAIRQSLGENSGESSDQVDIWEALEGLPPGHSRVNFQGEDRLLQQAIEASISQTSSSQSEEPANTGGEQEDDLAVALRLSQEQERREREEEEEIMRQVLELSLREK